jgi:16S rRNA (cytosine967-C5)-methyltransferase
MNPRLIAVSCLEQIIYRKRKATAVIDRSFKASRISEPDRRLIFELVYGVLRRYFSLRADIFRFIDKSPPVFVQCVLLAGAYQIRHMRVPAYSAVDEMVRIVKQSRQNFASGLVNAVLRKLSCSPLPASLKPHEQCELPLWMHASWRKSFGDDGVCMIGQAIRTQPSVCIALLGKEKRAWMEGARVKGFQVKAGDLASTAVLLPPGTDVTCLPGYDRGQFVVMDQSAQLVVEALAVQSGQHVLDMCAAPGGKTALIAFQAGTSGMVTAVDSGAARIRTLKENMKRLRLDNVRVFQMDVRKFNSEPEEFDAVLVDAPCSASGILRRHPDAKFLHSKEDLVRHRRLQTGLLSHAADLVKRGGKVVYAVCSIHEEENEEVVTSLLSAKDMEPDALPDALKPFEAGAGMARILPAEHHDGFFIACLRKPEHAF